MMELPLQRLWDFCSWSFGEEFSIFEMSGKKEYEKRHIDNAVFLYYTNTIPRWGVKKSQKG